MVSLPLAPYFEFPTIQPTIYVGFSWTVFVVIAALLLGSVAPFLWCLAGARATRPTPIRLARDFPWWGIAAFIWTGVIWAMAWSSPAILAGVRRFSFTPLWLGYIVIVNAFLWWRSGYSLLTHRPRYLVQLFVLSAVFWWFFEYLNRFVHNWHYQLVEDYTPLEYFLVATPPFSTVLPAVLSTYLLLRTFPRLWWGVHVTWRLHPSQPRYLGGVALLLGALGLLGIAVFPLRLYPLVWVAPLILVTAAQATAGHATVFSSLTQGDWRPVWLAALSGILCGFFWEMWNWGSLPRWAYTVPAVQRFHLFEMPLIGYTGYLPFGVECLAIAHLYLSAPLLDDETERVWFVLGPWS